MSRNTRASYSLIEVTGQCKKCHDLFTVELKPLKKPADGTTHYFRPILTAHLAYQDHYLIHRPGHCGGEVGLIMKPQMATFQ